MQSSEQTPFNIDVVGSLLVIDSCEKSQRSYAESRGFCKRSSGSSQREVHRVENKKSGIKIVVKIK